MAPRWKMFSEKTLQFTHVKSEIFTFVHKNNGSKTDVPEHMPHKPQHGGRLILRYGKSQRKTPSWKYKVLHIIMYCNLHL